ncbi:MAG: pyruvate kinase [Firmicutes bacterium]|nr:pyruvate kinase [Bacillota bacterium]
MRRTKIVATMGPACDTPERLEAVIRAGADVIRINLSHGTPADLARRLETVAAVRTRLAPERVVGLMLDTRGPEIRIGDVPPDTQLQPGERVRLSPRPGPAAGRELRLSVDYDRLAADVRPGQTVLVDDGNLVWEVEAVEGADVLLRVRAGGPLKSGKKLNVPGAELALPVLLPEDERDLAAGLRAGADFVAASFIRRAEDVIAVRRVIEACGRDAAVIAKIETRQAVERIGEILKAADGVMVARGDLGVECAPEDVPLIQKDIIRRCAEQGKPVITATQMLESMVAHPRPTRAEAADVANAILDGTDAVMLSAESAAGLYPVEAVAVMARIAERTEEAFPHEEWLARYARAAAGGVTDAVCHATVAAAADLSADAIITATESGFTARMVARLRPRARILAVTPDPATLRRLTLVWGVEPYPMEVARGTDDLLERAVRAVQARGAVRDGDLVVITAGLPAGVRGTTNLMKVHTVGDVILRGQGLGQGAATGPVHVALRPADLAGFRPGAVLVAPATDRAWMDAIRQAAAVITEEGGLTSHAAVVGISLGIPTIVGAKGATAQLKTGQVVTVDSQRGLVYPGEARTL